MAAISYNWTLRDLKLVGYHSINHSICNEHIKGQLIKDFDIKWNQWVRKFLGNEHIDPVHRWVEPDVFSGVRGWSWSQKESQALEKFEKLRESTIKKLPDNFYQGKY